MPACHISSIPPHRAESETEIRRWIDVRRRGCMDAYMHGWIIFFDNNGWIDGWMGGVDGGWIGGVGVCMYVCIYVCIYGWMDG